MRRACSCWRRAWFSRGRCCECPADTCRIRGSEHRGGRLADGNGIARTVSRPGVAMACTVCGQSRGGGSRMEWCGANGELAGISRGAADWGRRVLAARADKGTVDSFLAWMAICFAGVVLGWRFFPRYYFLLLPALTIPAARGLTLIRSRAVIAVALLTMMVPLVRFGPRYAMLSNWNDLALDRDSREASRIALRYAPPDGSLYVWGYRPEDYVYTGLRPATRFLDCQAMTGRTGGPASDTVGSCADRGDA